MGDKDVAYAALQILELFVCGYQFGEPSIVLGLRRSQSLSQLLSFCCVRGNVLLQVCCLELRCLENTL